MAGFSGAMTLFMIVSLPPCCRGLKGFELELELEAALDRGSTREANAGSRRIAGIGPRLGAEVVPHPDLRSSNPRQLQHEHQLFLLDGGLARGALGICLHSRHGATGESQ